MSEIRCTQKIAIRYQAIEMLESNFLISAAEGSSDNGFALLGMIVVAMIAKNYCLKQFERDRAITTFVILLCAFTVVLWVLFPDAQDRHVKPEATYIAIPVLVLGVPVISFVSYILRDAKPNGFSIQDVAEILFIPVWFVVCTATCFALNWIWI